MADTTEPTTISTQDFRKHLADTLDQVRLGDGYVKVTKNGKIAAYVVSPAMFERLTKAGPAA